MNIKAFKNLLISPPRLNRMDYFLRALAIELLISGTTFLYGIVHDLTLHHKNSYLYLKLFFDFIVLPPIAIALFIAAISVLVSRLHDLNKGAVWLVLIFLVSKIPFIGAPIILLVLHFWPGTKGLNKFGEQPKYLKESTEEL